MIEITRYDEANRGRYEAQVDGFDEAGLLSYSKPSAGVLIADHTGVPDALRGRGIAKRLVEKLVEDARAENFSIVPLCPFVKAQFDRNPDWSDLLHSP